MVVNFSYPTVGNSITGPGDCNDTGDTGSTKGLTTSKAGGPHCCSERLLGAGWGVENLADAGVGGPP